MFNIEQEYENWLNSEKRSWLINIFNLSEKDIEDIDHKAMSFINHTQQSSLRKNIDIEYIKQQKRSRNNVVFIKDYIANK